MGIEEIRLQRTHITEEAAHLAVLNDFASFKKEFPGVIVPADPRTVRLGNVSYPESLEYGIYVMRERYADYNLVACLLFIRIETDFDGRAKIGGWLDNLRQAKQIDCNPSGL